MGARWAMQRAGRFRHASRSLLRSPCRSRVRFPRCDRYAEQTSGPSWTSRRTTQVPVRERLAAADGRHDVVDADELRQSEIAIFHGIPRVVVSAR